MKIYLLPGLGFDHRIYRKLNFEGLDCTFLNWIEPEKNESIQHYAERFAQEIKETDEKITLIGHSLGGILSQEIATFKTIDKIILISSIKSRQELPFHFKIVKPFAVQHIFTKNLTIKSLPYWGKSHGYETDEEQGLLVDMVSQYSNYYLQWALRQLSIWQTPSIPKHSKRVHIHGTNDKTLPYSLIHEPDFTIQNGSHFMVYKQPERMQSILLAALEM